LFPVAGKNNYSASVMHFLATVYDNPELHHSLRYAASINLTDDGHYLAYHEALERFSVKFIKETVVENMTDSANLKNNIRAAQMIHERLKTVKFVSDPSIMPAKGHRP
jgi:hypothetical protein